MDDLVALMALLRQPDGCPWDAAQTHQSIRANMLEEAYEVAEAIDQNDPAHLKEELGDVLLQVVFHARMEQERGGFTFDDVVDGICKKLVFRHPHVFGTVEAGSSEEALAAWDAQKRREKGQKTPADALDAVARSLPSLTRAEKLQSKAAKAGLDRGGAEPALDELSEELEELKQAVREHSDVSEQLGSLLFTAAKVGRVQGLDSELALHAACEKFIRRFRTAQELAGDVPMADLTGPELEKLWREAKGREKRT